MEEPASPSGSRLLRHCLIFVALGTIGFALTRDLGSIVGFLAGGAITVGNLWLLGRIISGLLGENRPSKWKLALQVLIKFGGMLGIIAALLFWIKPKPIPFLLGLSTLLPAVLLEGLLGLRNR